MRNALSERFGIEFPVYAFTHCRDVVVEVSKAGGLGVLGAVGFSVEQLKVELDWIDEHIGDKPYGVDIVLPQKYDGDAGEMDVSKLTGQLTSMIPDEHRQFVRDVLEVHGVPEMPGDEELGSGSTCVKLLTSENSAVVCGKVSTAYSHVGKAAKAAERKSAERDSKDSSMQNTDTQKAFSSIGTSTSS